MFDYGEILKGSQTDDLSGNTVPLFDYGAIFKGSQTLLSAQRQNG